MCLDFKHVFIGGRLKLTHKKTESIISSVLDTQNNYSGFEKLEYKAKML